jgi:predicted GNAT family acetyltransferase
MFMNKFYIVHDECLRICDTWNQLIAHKTLSVRNASAAQRSALKDVQTCRVEERWQNEWRRACSWAPAQANARGEHALTTLRRGTRRVRSGY